MLALRWIMGSILVFLGGGFACLVMVSNGFRRSLGASPVHVLFVALPMIGMALLLAALIAPTHRALLHVAAGAAVLLVGFAIWQLIAEAAVVMWWGLLYLAVWFAFYVQALKATPLSAG
ncbi:MAG: hypothetical protein IT456_25270 [Planctomycetes bacterium]|nr:hypothetical protein [Planctomycetota bacterium]MCC7066131.1 hypothetical protein [Planctomycetota bacterium]